MCSLLAPRAAAPGFGAAALLDRRRGVVAVAAVVPSATSGHSAGEPTCRASDSTAPAARKRGRHDDGIEHVAVDPAPPPALRVRMDKELVELQGLLKRAKLLPRAEKKCAPPPPRRSEPAPAVSSAAKRSRASQSKAAATEAAYQTQITAPPANSKQQRPVQRAAAKNPIDPEVGNNKQRPAEAPSAAKQQQRPVQRAAAKTEAPKKRRPSPEELARAAARAEFRKMLLEMEKAALPDETIYPEDLQELGIAFEHVMTRTRKEAGMAG